MWIADGAEAGALGPLHRWSGQNPPGGSGAAAGGAIARIGGTTDARYLPLDSTGGGHWSSAIGCLGGGRCRSGPLTFNVKPMNFKHTGVCSRSRRPTGILPWMKIRRCGAARSGC